MKLKKRLISFPVGLVLFIFLLVSIVSWNCYLINSKQQAITNQLNISIALLSEIKTTQNFHFNTIVANKLKQLRQLKSNSKKLYYFNQFSSIFILVGSVLLCVVFWRSMKTFDYQLNSLIRELSNITRKNLSSYDLNYSVKNKFIFEIDYLANMLKQITADFKSTLRHKNGMLAMIHRRNKELERQQF